MAEKELNIIGHLDELRKRIIITAIAFVIFMIPGLYYVKNIYLFFLGNFHYKLLVLGPSDIIKVYFNLAALLLVQVQSLCSIIYFFLP